MLKGSLGFSRSCSGIVYCTSISLTPLLHHLPKQNPEDNAPQAKRSLRLRAEVLFFWVFWLCPFARGVAYQFFLMFFCCVLAEAEKTPVQKAVVSDSKFCFAVFVFLSIVSFCLSWLKFVFFVVFVSLVWLILSSRLSPRRKTLVSRVGWWGSQS